MLITRFAVRIFLVLVTVLGAPLAFGQDYPNKPIRIITAAPGGGSDFVARIIGSGISGPLGQPVIIDNRTSGLIPIEAAAKTPPDGYSLLVNGGTVWITPLLRKVPYDAVADFAPISLITREVLLLTVHPSVPVKSTKELIVLAKARPAALNYGAGDVGGTGYFALEQFKSLAGVNIVHIPYRSSALVVTMLVAGEVQVAAYDASLVAPHAKSGRLRALAVTTAEPSALAPGLPTVAESGVPGYEMEGRTGIWAPAKTPTAIINRLNQEIVRVFNQPDVKERCLNAWLEPVASSPEQFASVIKSDVVKFGKLVKDAGIKAE